MKLKVMSNVKFATDTDSGDVYLIDGDGNAIKVADSDGMSVADADIEKED